MFELFLFFKIINTDPSSLTKVSSNLDSVRYLFTLIDDKEHYFKILYKEGRKKSNFLLKEKGLYNSKSPLLYAAFTGNAEFINYMIEQGYVLNDQEKEFIKQHELEDKINNFEDNVYIKHLQKIEDIENNEDKVKYLFQQEKENQIFHSDLIKILSKFDLSNLDFTYRPFIYESIGYSEIRNLYLDNKASLSDIFMYFSEQDIVILTKLNIPLNLIQTTHLTAKLEKSLHIHLFDFMFKGDFLESKAKDYYDYFLYFIKQINPDFIYNQYKQKISNIHAFSPLMDLFLTKHVQLDDLEKNKIIYLNQSLFMNAKCVENDILLNENEIAHTCTIIQHILNQISLNTEDKEDKLIYDAICKSIILINTKFDYFAANLYETIKENHQDNSTIMIFLDKLILQSNISTPLYVKQMQRL